MRLTPLLSLATLALAACTTPAPMTAPAPTELTSPLTPSAVVQIAVQTLAAKGFTVTTSDATNGIMVATHAIERGHEKDWLACRWGPDAVGWHMLAGSVTVTVAAKSSGAGSTVSITGTAHATPSDAPPLLVSHSTDDCVSNGSAEAAIAKAISQ